MVRRRALDGGAVETLTDVSGWYPRISPDGREVAAYFADAESGQHQLGLVPSGGGAPRFLDLPGAYRMLEWSPDGGALTCYRRDGTTMLIENVPLDGGDPSPVTDLRGASLAVTDADWSSSGDSLALCLESRSFDVTLVQGFEKAIRGGR